MHFVLCASYFSVLGFLAMYGLHRSHLVITCLRHARALRAMKDEVPPLAPDALLESVPHVTIQLPLYNEATVAARLLEHIARVDYPREKLEIQVLDDSTDETRALLRSLVSICKTRRRKIRTKLPSTSSTSSRVDRVGYKAGALDAGLKVAKGDLVAVFDADFLPQPDFLRALVPHFMGTENEKVGMVQARWGHLNRDALAPYARRRRSCSTGTISSRTGRLAAGWLQLLRARAGCGASRRSWTSKAGEGHRHADGRPRPFLPRAARWLEVRLSRRASSLPRPSSREDVSAFRAQQFRWAKGTVQTARKLLRRVITAPLTPMQRLEAVFHLTPHFAYPLMVFLSVLLLPALILMPATDARAMILIDLPLCIGTTGSLAAFYAMAMTAQGRTRWSAMKQLPALLALGAGLAPHLTKAVVEGLGSMAGEFVRTPKKGVAQGRYRARADIPMAEIVLCMVSLASVVASVKTGHWFATPFAMLFTFGYGYVATLVGAEEMARRAAGAKLALAEGNATSVPLPASRRGKRASRQSGVTRRGPPHAPSSRGIALRVIPKRSIALPATPLVQRLL